jgi:hypothetical protein
MSSRHHLLGAALALCFGAAATPATAAHDQAGAGGHYEIVVTNLTRGQQFTPFLVATHKAGVKLFELGAPASPALIALAENGDIAPMTAALLTQPDTGDVRGGSTLTGPGHSVSFKVDARGGFSRFSLAAMLIPTNDAFVALDGVPLPHGSDTLTVMASAYDAGSERNDELCASIPGPGFIECGGPGGGGAPAGGEEGFVHVHAGIHGVGNLQAPLRDWRNPIARVTVRRVR